MDMEQINLRPSLDIFGRSDMGFRTYIQIQNLNMAQCTRHNIIGNRTKLVLGWDIDQYFLGSQFWI